MDVLTYKEVATEIEQKIQQHFERIVGKGWVDIEPDAKQGGTWAYCEDGSISLIVMDAHDGHLNLHYKEIHRFNLFVFTRLNLSTFDARLGSAFNDMLTIPREELATLRENLSMENIDNAICKFLEELPGYNGKPSESMRVALSEPSVFIQGREFIADRTASLNRTLEFEKIVKKLIN